MLNRARDADRDVELRRHGLTRRSNLSIDRQPLSIADGTRRSQIAAQRFGKFFRQREIVFAFDTTADRDNDVGLTEIDSLLCFLERRLGFHAHFADLYRHRLDLRTTPLHSLVTAKRARLKSDEGW